MKRHVLGWLALVLLLAESAAGIDLFVRNPRDGQVVFGLVEVELEVLSSEPVTAVEVRLDGELVARLTDEPYKVIVDIGEENVSHTLEFTATDLAGDVVTRTVRTGVLRVDMELDLELQQLYVTATHDGRQVSGLGRGDFEVLDDGMPQEVVTFEGGDVPLTAVLLIDSSRSMEGEALAAALAGARAFVEEMQELDRAKVIVFSDRILAATPFTGDPAIVGAGLEDVSAGGDTAIHDHLYVALKELEREQGRKVVILLSDGIDVESVLDMADVEWKAGRMQSLLYWIRPGASADPSGYRSIWRDEDDYRRQIEGLERVVTSSGGRIRGIAGLDEAAEAFRDILRELRGQYVIGYYPKVDRDDGAWHEVEVRVRTPGVKVRARGGYYDDHL